jgi:hypothetical protein
LVTADAVDGGSLGAELALLLVASAISTGSRFLLMPAWVFRRERQR